MQSGLKSNNKPKLFYIHLIYKACKNVRAFREISTYYLLFVTVRWEALGQNGTVLQQDFGNSLGKKVLHVKMITQHEKYFPKGNDSDTLISCNSQGNNDNRRNPVLLFSRRRNSKRKPPSKLLYPIQPRFKQLREESPLSSPWSF